MGNSNTSILIVDDEVAICEVVSNYLSFNGFECRITHDVDSALNILKDREYDCILSDMNMPGKSGLDLMRDVQRNWPEIAIILFTALPELHTAVDSMKEGASDFITKPVQLKQLLKSINNALEKKYLRSDLKKYQNNLEILVKEGTAKIQEAMHALEISHLDTINRLCHAAEYRDDETGMHVLRIGKYCELLARELSLSEQDIFLVGKASPLHDIGKIGIPDSILLKPGKLAVEEFEIMKSHANIGGEILKNATSKVLQMAETIARSHHEKWDGKGYPNGLKGENIPIMGRIAAVADVFDALTMKRCYKPAFTWETSNNIINQGSGKHFDPKIVEAFNQRFRDFINIQKENAEIHTAH